jgi:UDP-glucose-4-epimerase GalE
MTILVTGGAGYVGSHTVRLLGELGYDVVVVDNLESGNRGAVIGAELVIGDIRDAGLLESVISTRHVDALVHFAAYKASGDSMADPGGYFDNNVAGTASVLRAAESAGVRRVVFSSSCSVYGSPAVVPVRETHPVQPESPYGESKLIAERMLRWFDSCCDMRYVSLRYFNAAGASLDSRIGEDWSVTTNLVPVAVRAACGRRPPVQVMGTDYPTADGTAIRDYVHVLDLAEAHALALEYILAGGPSTILNLGTGRGASVLEVLEELQRVAGREVPWVATGRRPGDPVALWADNRKACDVLRWQPRYDLVDILATAWRWHSSHPYGFGTRAPFPTRAARSHAVTDGREMYPQLRSRS